MRRMPGTLREQAQAAQTRGDLPQAAQHWQAYVNLVPQDVDARAELALLLHATAQTADERACALDAMQCVLNLAPSRRDVRQQVVHAALASGRHADAATHLKALLAETPKNADLWLRLGDAEFSAQNWIGAAGAYHMVLRTAPERVAVYQKLAGLLIERFQRPSSAAKVIARMLAANPRNAAAADIYRTFWQERLSPAGNTRPRSDVLAEGLDLLVDNSDHDEMVETWLNELRRLEPDNFRTAELEVRLMLARGETDAALERLDAACQAAEDTGGNKHRAAQLLMIEAKHIPANEPSAQVLLERAERYLRLLVSEHPEHTAELIDFLAGTAATKRP
jgi:predicted Zn-dependent protease